MSKHWMDHRDTGAAHEFERDAVAPLARTTCPNCNGAGYMVGGFGHFGDCNGDAGRAWKPCMSPCRTCDGTGSVEVRHG